MRLSQHRRARNMRTNGTHSYIIKPFAEAGRTSPAKATFIIMRRFPVEACLVEMPWRARESVLAARMVPRVKPLWWWRRRACHHIPDSTHQPAEEDCSATGKSATYRVLQFAYMCVLSPASLQTKLDMGWSPWGLDHALDSAPASCSPLKGSPSLDRRCIVEETNATCYYISSVSFMIHQSWEDPQKEKVQVPICIMIKVAKYMF